MIITQEEKTNFLAETTDIIQSLVNLPELDDLNGKQLQAVAKSFVFDELKAKLKSEVKKKKLNIKDLIKRWLSRYDSDETIRKYRRNLKYFLDWHKGNILDVTAKTTDDYTNYLKKLTAATKSQRIAACSSFWTFLIRNDIVKTNYWHGVKLPKPELHIKTTKDIPTNKELDAYKAYALSSMTATGRGANNKVSGSKLAYVALAILRATGMRVGALQSLTIDKKGSYKAESKGGYCNGKLDANILALIKEYKLNSFRPFQDYRSFAKWFQRADKGFNVHSIRHRFSVDHYNRHKDIIQLQKKLGHKSLVATQSYLASLVNEIEL